MGAPKDENLENSSDQKREDGFNLEHWNSGTEGKCGKI